MISAADMTPFANHLWQSTLFAVAVWILTLVFRSNRAAVRHRLWLAASIKFLIPFSLLASLGSRIPTGTTSISAPSEVSAVVETISEPFAASYPTTMYIPEEVAPASQSQGSRIPAALVWLWFLGFVGSSLWWFFRWRQIHRVVQTGARLDLGIPNLPVRLIKRAKQMEPGVFGIIRPILLLPDGITGCLSTDELQSVIAHELCHVRRRDNLATAVHMFVEALFWFHPLVWWIKSRLLEEQERACDEEVLALGTNRQVYAESILKICTLYVNPPLACVAGIAGSNLKQRIETIMNNRIGIGLSIGRKALLATASVAAIVSPIAIGVLQARAHRIEPQQSVVDASAPVIATPLPQVAMKTRSTPTAAAPQIVNGTVIRGFWEIENPAMVGPNRTPFPDKIQLTFDGRTGKSFGLDALPFRGLSAAQIQSPARTTVQFELETEAGRFVCDGEFETGRGRGGYVFYPDTGFAQQMAALNFRDIQDQQLISMALQGVGPRFLSELRSVGITDTTFDELMGLRAVGVTGDYIRLVHEAGYAPNPNELISMWVQGVTPEFATQMRQQYPGTSPNDLVGMRVSGVPANSGRRIYRTSLTTSTNLPQTWAIDARAPRNGAVPNGVQLTFFNSNTVQGNTVPFDSSVFRGLTVEQLMSPTQTAVRFDIVKDAGTFACDGYFLGGHGSGTSVFQPNPNFRAEMLALGVQDVDDRWLFAMALNDVSLQFARELRDAGVAFSTPSQLLNLRVQNVTPEFAREIRRVYPSVSINQMVNMRVQNVTPDFVSDVRQLYPSASINDLINMRVQNVTPEFAREMLRLNPSISIRGLVQMKVQTR